VILDIQEAIASQTSGTVQNTHSKGAQAIAHHQANNFLCHKLSIFAFQEISKVSQIKFVQGQVQVIH